MKGKGGKTATSVEGDEQHIHTCFPINFGSRRSCASRVSTQDLKSSECSKSRTIATQLVPQQLGGMSLPFMQAFPESKGRSFPFASEAGYPVTWRACGTGRDTGGNALRGCRFGRGLRHERGEWGCWVNGRASARDG